jgi:hypothetical protein
MRDFTKELANLSAAATEIARTIGIAEPPPGGSLTVVGTGIRAIGQLTVESLAAMATAEALFHVVGEPLQEEALRLINPVSQTLTGYYVDGMDRLATYEAMVQTIVQSVLSGQRTVAAFYGHPGVFTYPTHESVRRVRRAGYPARMLPAVSAEDCLFADLGIDPGDGCQSYEATDFVIGGRVVDVRSHLVLWQVGALGSLTYEESGYDLKMLPSLVGRLAAIYGPTHRVTVYEAPFAPGGRPRIARMPVMQLDPSGLTLASTLHLGPVVMQ